MKSHSKPRQKRHLSIGLKSTKEIKQLAVSVAILEIIENDGLLGVTHSKVSRKSKVSRAWIYEYIGKEKSDLIEFGADVFAGHIARVEDEEIPESKQELQEQLKEAVEFLFDSVERNPLTFKLFFRFRGTSNPVGKVIQKYEKQWLESATQTIIKVYSLPLEQASLAAESVLILRLGFAHRIATSVDRVLARNRAETILNMIQSIALEGI